MSHNNQKQEQQKEQYAHLAARLEQAGAQTPVPMPRSAKAVLRQRLLSQYDQPSLSRRAAINLWRFAGTAVAIFTLTIAVGWFWLTVAPGAPAGNAVTAPVRETPPPTVSPTATMAADSAEAGFPPAQATTPLANFANGVMLMNYSLTQTTPNQENGAVIIDDGVPADDVSDLELGGTLHVTLTMAGMPETAVSSFLHLYRHDGQLIAQQDVPLAESTTFAIDLPTGLADGEYTLAMGLYNSATQARITTTTAEEYVYLMQLLVLDGQAMVQIGTETIAETAVPNAGITETIPAAEDTSAHAVWITGMQQTDLVSSDRISLTVTVGYTLTGRDEGVLKLFYAAPGWESVGDGRIPLDGLSDFTPITADEHSITITFTGSKAEMAQIVGTEMPVLGVQMGYFVPTDNDARRLELIALETFPEWTLDLSRDAP